jgi:poly(hydroxyalkanoate) depolymerase family esterase
MRSFMSPTMAEATRLTRAGRLMEATAVLRGGPFDSRTIEGEAEEVTPPPPRFSFRSRQAPRPDAVSIPPGARFLHADYAEAAGHRAYRLYIPASRRAEAAPLLVMLHGCTQSPEDFAAGTRMNELAEEHGLIVAYPGQPPSANPQKCWNWFKPGDQVRGHGEPALIAGITRQVVRDHAIDPARIFIAGLSAGGAAAAIMGQAYPDLYAAVGVHSGLACGAARDIPSAFAAMNQGTTAASKGRPIRTIVFHADRDTTVHPRNGDAVITQSGVAGLRVEVQRGRDGHGWQRTIHRDADGRAMLEQWVIEGGGHAWSGGSPAGSYTDPAGPDASRAMLRYFLDGSREG